MSEKVSGHFSKIDFLPSRLGSMGGTPSVRANPNSPLENDVCRYQPGEPLGSMN